MGGKIEKKHVEKITLQAASPWTSCSGGRTAEIERPTSGLESEDVMLPQRCNPREGREGGRQQSPVPTQLNRIRFQVSWLISDTTSWRWCPEVNITYKTSRCTDPVSVSPLIPDRNVKLVPEKRNESESRFHFLFNNRAWEPRGIPSYFLGQPRRGGRRSFTRVDGEVTHWLHFHDVVAQLLRLQAALWLPAAVVPLTLSTYLTTKLTRATRSVWERIARPTYVNLRRWQA